MPTATLVTVAAGVDSDLSRRFVVRHRLKRVSVKQCPLFPTPRSSFSLTDKTLWITFVDGTLATPTLRASSRSLYQVARGMNTVFYSDSIFYPSFWNYKSEIGAFDNNLHF